MPRPPRKDASRPYGRQAKDKTIKSLSIESDLLAKAEKEAKKRGMNFSEYISALLKGTLLAAISFHAFRSSFDWSAGAIAKSGKAVLGFMASLL